MTPSNPSTSFSLLERVRNRDEQAWGRLVHLYAPLVTVWCGRWQVRGDDAEDVVQEVFGAVSAHLDAFRRDRPGDSFRGWLRAITRNKLLDLFRRRQRQPAAPGGSEFYNRLLEVPEPELPEDTADDLGALYHRALELIRGEFEERTWQAFYRAAVAGHSPAVIAADLGVTQAAVRKAKSRVLLRLRQEVGDLTA
jgi:RNA polymerase sigma-70 factor (ECF subfamily)